MKRPISLALLPVLAGGWVFVLAIGSSADHAPPGSPTLPHPRTPSKPKKDHINKKHSGQTSPRTPVKKVVIKPPKEKPRRPVPPWITPAAVEAVGAQISNLEAAKTNLVEAPVMPPEPVEEQRRHVTFKIALKLQDADGDEVAGFDLAGGAKVTAAVEEGNYYITLVTSGWSVDLGERGASSVTVKLEDPKWEFVGAQERTKQSPINWDRGDTEDVGTPYPAPTPAEPLLPPRIPLETLIASQATEAAGQPVRPAKAADALAQAVVRLQAARQAIDDGLADRELLSKQFAAIRPGGRRQIQMIMARCHNAALLSLDEAETLMRAVDTAAGGASGPAATNARVKQLLQQMRARAASYRAEALWWRAELLDPTHPDREPALKVVREATAQDAVADQRTLYQQVAMQEKELERQLDDAIRAGTYNRKPVQVQDVTRTVRVEVKVRRRDAAQ